MHLKHYTFRYIPIVYRENRLTCYRENSISRPTDGNLFAAQTLFSGHRQFHCPLVRVQHLCRSQREDHEKRQGRGLR